MTASTVDAVERPAFLAFGDLGVDSVVSIDHLPRADEKLWVEPVGDFSGGMMGNAAVAVASLGISAGVAGLIGNDARAGIVLDGLRERGVDTRFVRVVDAPTFWALSLTIPSGDRTLIQFPTAAFGGDWDGFDRTLLEGIRWVHSIAEEGDPVGPLLRDAQRAGATTSLDIEFPFIVRPELPAVLEHVDVAFMNAAAADALGGPEAAARFVQERGPSLALVTLGERGAFLRDADGTCRTLPAIPVEAVDTNGAGDQFAGAFAAGVLKGLAPADAAELAVWMAGRSTTVAGGHGPAATPSELRELAGAAGYGWWESL
jgi:sugar/nucleoside kinase (ribokinase family)